ncbi:hypothetical protein ACVWZK_007647 [Bradyrhizobium sp. GM0.4]
MPALQDSNPRQRSRKHGAKPLQKLLLGPGSRPGGEIVAPDAVGQAGILAEQALGLALAEAGKRRCLQIGRAAIGGLDRQRDLVRQYRRQAKADVNRAEQTFLDRLVMIPSSTALNGEIMSPITYSGASCSSAASRMR